MSSIERQVDIEASDIRVWKALTEPGELTRWYCSSVDLAVRRGAEGTMSWVHDEARDPTVIHVRVEALEPARRFAFRWVHDGHQIDTSAPLFEFTLTPQSARTLVCVVESGLQPHDSTGDEDYLEQHEEGWAFHLQNLKRYAEQAAEAGEAR